MLRECSCKNDFLRALVMVIVLRDGEEVHGIIEWYDRNCIKVNRENGAPNLMIYKPAIKYMFKEGEGK